MTVRIVAVSQGNSPRKGSPSLPPSSLITAYHGDATNTWRLLERLAGNWRGAPTEVVVVDNNCQRNQTEPASSDFPFSVKTVHEPRPGLSIARNAALDLVSHDLVLCTDADTVPQPGWADRLVLALVETGASCAGGRTDLLVTSGASPEEFDAPHFAAEQWPATRCELVPPYWLVGCNLAFRASLRMRFREDLGVIGTRHRSCEDLEFVQQVVERDLPVLVVPEAVVQRPVHREDLSFSGLLNRKYWQGWSMAVCKQLHPSMVIFDNYSWRSLRRDILARPGLVKSLVTETARLTGWSACWALYRLGLRRISGARS
jgi:glycosyltransferase involved in cell wall biosynthesis